MMRSEAFLDQAKSDFVVFRTLAALSQEEIPGCHPLHYLQMAIEKLCKAVVYRTPNVPTTHSHKVVGRLISALNRPDCHRILGYRSAAEAYGRRVRSVRVALEHVEALHPNIAAPKDRAPNLEYPWEPPATPGYWTAPCHHARFNSADVLTAKGASAVGFVELLLKRFPQLP